jgi:hypothetical protein
LRESIDDVLGERTFELDAVKDLVGVGFGRGAGEKAKVKKGLDLWRGDIVSTSREREGMGY